MKCQKCNTYEATVHLTEVINGVKKEAYLCKNCADFDKSPSFSSPFETDFGSFFQSVLGASGAYQKSVLAPKTCKICKSTLEDIQRRGRIGCGECYNTFRQYLLRPLKEIHGSATHTGKIPKRIGITLEKSNTVEKLKEALNRAVLDQNFEKAAELRDQIREIEKEAN